MTMQRVVSWSRLYCASLILLIMAVVTSPINKAVSFVFWILLLSLLTEIPGLINEYLIEVNISEFLVALLAIHFGGIKIAIIATIYVLCLPIFSRMWRPTFAIKSAASTFIAYSLVPFLYFGVFNQNLLWTLYTYTAILYSTYFLQTLFTTPAMIFDDLKFAMISLPIAYLTNLVYVGVFEAWAMNMFKPTLNFPFFLKVAMFLFLIGIGVFISLQKYPGFAKPSQTSKLQNTNLQERDSLLS